MWFNDDDEPFDLAQDSDQAAEPDDDLGYERPDMWVAHDRPDRPLAYGAWLCDCSGCLRALETAATANPHLPIVLKTSADRIIVSASRAVREWHERGALEGLLLLSYDYIREVFVAEGPPRNWDGEFWSLHHSLSRKGRKPRQSTRK
jgi:hypothetical protein